MYLFLFSICCIVSHSWVERELNYKIIIVINGYGSACVVCCVHGASVERQRIFKSPWKWERARVKLLLSVCTSFRIDFYQRDKSSCSYCFCVLFVVLCGVCVHYFTSHCMAFQSRLCLILLRDGGPNDKLLGPYWNLLLNLFVSRVIVATLLYALHIRSLVQSDSSCVSSEWLANTRSRDSSDSNELLPLKMQKHFTLLFFLMHT